MRQKRKKQHERKLSFNETIKLRDFYKSVAILKKYADENGLGNTQFYGDAFATNTIQANKKSVLENVVNTSIFES